tara:strand:+ start:28336 stop:30036 length:1701 start_codon:yes stop_codon:yes gene_type:complete
VLIKKILPIVFFVFSFYLSYSIGELYYLSTNSPDFGPYSEYFYYFDGSNQITSREQGLLYFYLVFLLTFLKGQALNEINFDVIINSSIHSTNAVLYIIGLTGLYYLLSFKGFKRNNIFYIFTMINFLPVSLMLRWTYKPEILIFCLITWTFYLIEKAGSDSDIRTLYISLLPLSIILTSKATVFGMVSIALLFYFYKLLKVFGIKKLVIPVLVLLIFIIGLSVENYSANQKLLFQYEDLNEKLYNNPAELSLLYEVNFYDLFFSPFRHYHSNSLIGITLLETYGDYYFWYFDNDKSLFAYNSIDLIPSIPFLAKYEGSLYQSQLVTLFYSIISFLSLLFLSIKYKKYRYFLLLPLVGYFVLSLQAFGLTSSLLNKNINFDKNTSDIFKVFYSGFFVLISFSFLYGLILRKLNKTKPFVVITFLLSMLLIYGFPQERNVELQNYLEVKNSQSYFCNINGVIFDLDTTNCGNTTFISCLKNDKYVNPVYLYKPEKNASEEFVPRLIINSTGEMRTVYSVYECEELSNQNFINASFFKENKRTPWINLLIFIISLSLILYQKSKFYSDK